MVTLQTCRSKGHVLLKTERGVNAHWDPVRVLVPDASSLSLPLLCEKLKYVRTRLSWLEVEARCRAV